MIEIFSRERSILHYRKNLNMFHLWEFWIVLFSRNKQINHLTLSIRSMLWIYFTIQNSHAYNVISQGNKFIHMTHSSSINSFNFAHNYKTYNMICLTFNNKCISDPSLMTSKQTLPNYHAYIHNCSNLNP